MADFIMSVEDRAQIQLSEDGGPANQGLSFEVLDSLGGNADISNAGWITPKRPGLVAIIVRNAAGMEVRELLGVIRSKAKFNYDHDLSVGNRRLSFLVTSLNSGLNLGGIVMGGTNAILSGNTIPALPPQPVGNVAAAPIVAGGALGITWTSTSPSAPYRIDIVDVNGTVVMSVFTGTIPNTALAQTLDVASLPIGTYHAVITNLSTLSSANSPNFTLTAPSSLGGYVVSNPSYAIASSSAPGTSPADAFNLSVPTPWIAGIVGPGSFIGQAFGATPPPVESIQWVQGPNPATAVIVQALVNGTWVTVVSSTSVIATPGVMNVIDIPPVTPPYGAVRLVATAVVDPTKPWSVSTMSFWNAPGSGFGTGPYSAAPYGV